jgi:Flp pilus assembly protein TadG
MKTQRLSTSGQSLVLIALLMVAMIAFLGLILDGGVVLANRRNSQDAADSAAFAGVRVLANRVDNSTTTEQAIWNNIVTFATANRIITATDVVASFIDASGADICRINQNCNGVPTTPYPTGVRVTTTLRMQPYFISLMIGNAPIPVRSVAAAQSGTAAGAPVMPMSLPFPCLYNPNDPNACTLNYGQSYQLQGDSQLPGGFQWVDYTGGASANDVVNYLTQYWTSGSVMADPQDIYVPYSTPQPSPSPWIPSGPGVSPNTNISYVLDCWLKLAVNLNDSCWGVVKGEVKYWGPRPTASTWIVPVFDQRYGTGNTALYHVVSFAEFQFQGYWFANNQCNYIGAQNPNCNHGLPAPLQSCADANQKCIMGSFLRAVTSLPTAPGICNTNALNICGIGLSQ